MKYAISRAIDPASILEVGVRYGYSAITFLNASPASTYLGIDNNTNTFGGSKGAIQWVKKITEGYKTDFLIANTQQMASFPGNFYDFIHIDGQQDGDGTIHDLKLALEKGRWLLLDGFFWSKENMLSATYFLEKYKEFVEFSLVIPSYAGELLIKTKPSAKNIFSGSLHSHYSELQHAYDNGYFMRDCGGFDSFRRNQGRKLEDPRLIAAYCLANPDENKKILDIGCGRGELAFALALSGADVTGIDYSQTAIDIAIRTFLSKKERFKLNFIRADMVTWPVSDQFNVIIATDLIEHIENEPLQKLMKKISGLLKPDGIAIFHTAPNKHYYDTYYSQLRTKARKAGCYLPENPRTYYEDLMHINEQTPESLTLLLKNNFNNCIVWVAKDHEMIGSLDKKYPPALINEARGIFAIASNSPISVDALMMFLSQPPLDPETMKVQLQIKNNIPSVTVNQQFSLAIQIDNTGSAQFASLAPYPVHISYHWLDRSGNIVEFDGIRSQIVPPLYGHSTREFDVTIVAPKNEGEYILQLTLVQENKFWFEEIIPNLPVELKFCIGGA
jgi:2-polyprenyl-3-methyl-5-hydroxy-6-metoxy-1,4-benzoquinol methylase